MAQNANLNRQEREERKASKAFLAIFACFAVKKVTLILEVEHAPLGNGD